MKKKLLQNLSNLGHGYATGATVVGFLVASYACCYLFGSSSSSSQTQITTYFQVTKPIKIPPKTKPCASLLLLKHDFGYTYGQSPVLVYYKPPTKCPSEEFAKIVLQCRSTVRGTQFDRIFGIWLSGVEILRSCTVEPRELGDTTWTVHKDITRYTSLLTKPQTLAVYLGNLVDSTYTGVYHVTLTFHFYPLDHKQPKQPILNVENPADLIIPISRSLPLNDGLWFLVENSIDIQSKRFSIPQNSYRAVLEVYVSFHSKDEFWYTNAYNLTNRDGNGPFREVVVRLDGDEVGAVWPFTVVFTGGFEFLLRRPITGIGSFDLPTYDIEITPFLGKILDGKQHEIGFGVTNALSSWYIDADLHIWLDHESHTTSGELIRNENPPSKISLARKGKGTYLTSATRTVSSSGWVKSSHGNITTNSFQDFRFTNLMTLAGGLQIVNQTIDANSRVYAVVPSSSPSYRYKIERYQNFPLYLYTDEIHLGHGNYNTISRISLGFNEKRLAGSSSSRWVSSILRNSQQGHIEKNVTGDLATIAGSTQQVYHLDGSAECYFWNVSSSWYTLLYNISGDLCEQKRRSM